MRKAGRQRGEAAYQAGRAFGTAQLANFLSWVAQLVCASARGDSPHCVGGCALNIHPFHPYPTAGALLMAPNSRTVPSLGWITEP